MLERAGGAAAEAGKTERWREKLSCLIKVVWMMHKEEKIEKKDSSERGVMKINNSG